MATNEPDPFRPRPLSIRAVLCLTDEIEAFEHSAPILGLEALEEPGIDGQAVVAVYVGFKASVAHYMGFDPNDDEWKSVSQLSRDEITDPAVVEDVISELMEWIASRYPGKELTLYEKSPG